MGAGNTRPKYIELEHEAGNAVLNNPDEALRLFREALQLKLQNKQELDQSSIGRSYLIIGIILGNRKQEHRQAIETITKSLEYLDAKDLPNFAMAHFYLA